MPRHPRKRAPQPSQRGEQSRLLERRGERRGGAARRHQACPDVGDCLHSALHPPLLCVRLVQGAQRHSAPPPPLRPRRASAAHITTTTAWQPPPDAAHTKSSGCHTPLPPPSPPQPSPLTAAATRTSICSVRLPSHPPPPPPILQPHQPGTHETAAPEGRHAPALGPPAVRWRPLSPRPPRPLPHPLPTWRTSRQEGGAKPPRRGGGQGGGGRGTGPKSNEERAANGRMHPGAGERGGAGGRPAVAVRPRAGRPPSPRPPRRWCFMKCTGCGVAVSRRPLSSPHTPS